MIASLPRRRRGSGCGVQCDSDSSPLVQSVYQSIAEGKYHAKWKTKYLQQVAARRRANEDTSVKELVNKKTGRPLMLGEDLDKQVQAYLKELRENGAVVNTAITIACARGVVKNVDSNLLECNGGHISLTKHWAKYLLERMGFVKRPASTKAKVSLPDFERFKAQFVFDVKAVIEMEEIDSQ